LAKTIALIDLFRNGTGIVAEPDTIQASVADVDVQLIDRALDDLEAWSIIIFRKHLDAWAIYAGRLRHRSRGCGFRRSRLGIPR
jgi:hypothetical protein